MTQEEGKEPSGDGANNEFDHKQGRPTIQEQAKIQAELRPYYEAGYNATFTANKTGYDIKTVLRHYNKWAQELIDSANGDFLNRVKEQKERTIVNIDNQIYSLEDFKKEIEAIRKAAQRAGNFEIVEKFSKLQLKTIEIIGKFVSAKSNLVNTATVDVLIELEKMGEKKDGV